MNSTSVFLVFIIIFITVLISVGLLTRKWSADSAGFILAGREISTVLNTFGVAAIGFAATSITVVPGFAVLYGFWGAYLSQAIYCIGGLSLYGVFFAPFVRRCGAQTLPEWLEMRFDGRVRLVITIGTIFGLAGIMANNIASMAVVITGFTQWPLFATISGMFFVFLLFSYLGGFWAITFTDFIQLLLGLVAVPLILFSLFSGMGNYAPVSSAAWIEGTAGTMPLLSLRYPSILTSLFLFAAFLVWGNNYYWLRAASCRSERAAKYSYLWAGILVLVPLYLPLSLIGIYTAAAFPSLFLGTVPPEAVYGIFLRELPVFFASFLMLVPFAAGVSTASTANIGATSVIVHDIYHRRINPRATSSQLLKISRGIILLLGLLVWLLSYYPGGPLILFAFATAWLAPPALILLLGIIWRRFSADGAYYSALISIFTMTVLTALELAGVFIISRYMHVGMAGIVSALLPAAAITFISEPRDNRQPERVKKTDSCNGEKINLTETHLTALKSIRQGFTTMADLADFMEADVVLLNKLIEELARGGYLKRDALIGPGFYSFKLTCAGEKQLPPLIEAEQQLAECNLTPESHKILRAAEENVSELSCMVSRGDISSLKLSVLLTRLVSLGYLKEGGLWRRTIAITPTGKKALDSLVN